MKLFAKESPLATPEEMDRLRALDARWQQWSSRMDRYTTERLSLDIQTTKDNFIADPSPEHGQALLLVADPKLLATRYRAVRDACKVALGRLAFELRDIMVPILERKIRRLEQEHQDALATEAKQRAAEKERGTIFQRQVNGPVESIQRAITNAKDSIKDLKELRVDRTPGVWIQSLG
jgi:hypothetical protein